MGRKSNSKPKPLRRALSATGAGKNGRSAFYRTKPWGEWWKEFCGELKKDGSFLYPTAWSFAKAKGSDPWEVKTIYRCIGPRPLDMLDKDGGKLPPSETTGKTSKDTRRTPWLGDWQQRRQRFMFYEDEKVQAIQQVISERLTALDAARGVANITLDWVARYGKYAEKIEAFFKNDPMPLGLSLESAEARMKIFLALQKRVFDGQMQALSKLLACYGIHEDDVSLLAQAAATGALAGHAQGQIEGRTQGQSDMVALALAQTMVKKSKAFGLPLPDAEDVENETRTLELSLENGNGKGK